MAEEDEDYHGDLLSLSYSTFYAQPFTESFSPQSSPREEERPRAAGASESLMEFILQLVNAPSFGSIAGASGWSASRTRSAAYPAASASLAPAASASLVPAGRRRSH